MTASAVDGCAPARVIPCAGREALLPGEAAAVAAATAAGGVVLFPTDTLYGLGVDPLSPRALGALYALKGREPGKPVPVLLADAALVARFAAAVPGPWRALMARFWPGPLTLLFPALAGLPRGVRSGDGKVALRVPGSALCRSVLAAAGGSLTGTSANRSGAGATGDPRVALRGLAAGLALALDAGTLPASPASTLLDVDAGGKVSVLRAGAVAEGMIAAVLEAARGGPGTG